MSRLYRFIVQGEGNFPLDMLRFDVCYPYQGKDVQALKGRGNREVELASHRKCTTDRWASFGWTVIREFVQ